MLLIIRYCLICESNTTLKSIVFQPCLINNNQTGSMLYWFLCLSLQSGCFNTHIIYKHLQQSIATEMKFFQFHCSKIHYHLINSFQVINNGPKAGIILHSEYLFHFTVSNLNTLSEGITWLKYFPFKGQKYSYQTNFYCKDNIHRHDFIGSLSSVLV